MEKMLVSIKRMNGSHIFKSLDFEDPMAVHNTLSLMELDPRAIMFTLVNSPIYNHDSMMFRFMLFPDAFILIIKGNDDEVTEVINDFESKLRDGYPEHTIDEQGFIDNMEKFEFLPEYNNNPMPYLGSMFNIHYSLKRSGAEFPEQV